MKKIVIALFVFLYFSIPLQAQWALQNWEYSTGFAFEEHDTRLYNYPPHKAQRILEQEDDPGTYHNYFVLRKSLIEQRLFAFKAGVGYSREVITFSRPYESRYFYPGNTGPEPLEFIGKYSKDMFIIPVSLNIYALKFEDFELYATGSIVTTYNFRKKITEKRGGSLYNYISEINAIEVNPGAGIKIGRIGLEVNYRWYQKEKRDEVMFSQGALGTTTAPHPDLEADFHYYNPRKIWFTLNFDLDPKDFDPSRLKGYMQKKSPQIKPLLQNMVVTTGFSFEKHDRRMFDRPEKNVDSLNGRGTSAHSFALQKPLIKDSLFSVFAGVGFVREAITFHRPYSKNYFDGGVVNSYYNYKSYIKNMLLVPVDLNFQLKQLKRRGRLGMEDAGILYAGLNATPSFIFRRKINTGLPWIKYSKFTFDINALEFAPSIGYRKNNLSFEAGVRAFQVEKIDRVIFNDALFEPTEPPHPYLQKSFETYNPLKVVFKIRYDFDFTEG